MSTLDFTNQYLPPGVYVEEDTTPLVSVIGVQPSVVGLVGPSVGYRTHTEAVTLSDTTPVLLGHLGIDPTSVAVAGADGTAYLVTDDWVTVVGGGADANTSTLPDNTLTIARSNPSDIENGSTVYVTYHYTDAEYHTPQRFQNYADVVDAFGQPLDLTTGAIVSPLSLAAKVTFENGASQVVCVATADSTSEATTRTHLTDAYALLGSFDDVDLLVPLPVGITGMTGSLGDLVNIGVDLKDQVESDASLNMLMRVAILGYETTVDIDPASDVVGSFPSSRMILAWPNRLNYYIGLLNQNVEVAGYYLAAAFAGQLASRMPQMPLTRKQIKGFNGFPGPVQNQMTTALKNTWSAAGVAVAEIARSGQMVCRHGTSTDPANVNTREISLTRAKDSMVEMIERTIEASNMIGTPITSETLIQVKGVVTGALETAKSAEVIIDYNGLSIRQTSTDPSVVQVKFAYIPAYPLNYIVVVFSIDTTTGQVSTIDLSSATSTSTGTTGTA